MLKTGVLPILIQKLQSKFCQSPENTWITISEQLFTSHK